MARRGRRKLSDKAKKGKDAIMGVIIADRAKSEREGKNLKRKRGPRRSKK